MIFCCIYALLLESIVRNLHERKWVNLYYSSICVLCSLLVLSLIRTCRRVLWLVISCGSHLRILGINRDFSSMIHESWVPIQRWSFDKMTINLTMTWIYSYQNWYSCWIVCESRYSPINYNCIQTIEDLTNSWGLHWVGSKGQIFWLIGILIITSCIFESVNTLSCPACTKHIIQK